MGDRKAALPTPQLPGPPPGIPRATGAEFVRGAIQLVGPDWDCILHADEVILGRDSTCAVLVNDPLVSRRHARICLAEDAAVLEDLRSTNGVYVNNVRIFEPFRLRDGDRLLLGATELCVFAAESQRVSHTRPLTSPPRPAPKAPPPAATDRATALEVLGRLAERMLSDRKPEHAERILADHLRKLLDGVRTGLPIPESVCKGASRHALRLARAVHDGRWVNYTIELHLRAELPMAPEVVAECVCAAAQVRGIDHALYGVYVEWLREQAERFGPVALAVVDELDAVRLPSE